MLPNDLIILHHFIRTTKWPRTAFLRVSQTVHVSHGVEGCGIHKGNSLYLNSEVRVSNGDTLFEPVNLLRNK